MVDVRLHNGLLNLTSLGAAIRTHHSGCTIRLVANQGWRCPTALEKLRLGGVEAHQQSERSISNGQPVRLLVRTRRVGLDVQISQDPASASLHFWRQHAALLRPIARDSGTSQNMLTQWLGNGAGRHRFEDCLGPAQDQVSPREVGRSLSVRALDKLLTRAERQPAAPSHEILLH